MKVLFLVSGGGEAMRRSVRDAIVAAAPQHELRLLAPDGEGKALRDTGVPIESWQPAGLFNVLRSINALRRAVDRFEPDVIHAFGWTASSVALGALVSRYARRMLVTLQDPIREKEMPRPFVEKRLPELLARAGAIDCAYATLERVITTSLKVPPERVSLAPYGVRDIVADPYERAPGRRGPIVGYIGRLEADRAWEVTLDALAAIVKTESEAQVRFARTGPVQSLVRAHARSQHVLDAVTFFDDLPLDEFLTDIDLLVVPKSRDGLPYSLVDALVNGIPVVASNTGGIADTLAPYAGWLVPDDAEGFAAGILAAWNGIDAAWDAAQAQRAAVRAVFSADVAAARQLALYERLAAEPVMTAAGES
jgi:glycosyltransferase involved in cell wall biosynthesis